MGDANTSNGVSRESNVKKSATRKTGAEMSVIDADIVKDIGRFTADRENGKIVEETIGKKTLNADCAFFEAAERQKTSEINNSSASEGSTDATTANTTIKMSDEIVQTLANVEISGVFVKVYEVEKQKDSKNQKDSKESKDLEEK